MNLQQLARLGIFGSTSGKAKPSWWKCIAGDLIYLVFKVDTGLPSVINQIEYYADVLWSAFFGPEAEQLPHDFPPKLFAAIDKVLLSRGGMFDRETEQRNFWAENSGCSSTPLTWTVLVEYSQSADPNRLESFEASIEEALTKAGFDCNVSVLRRPLRLRIDKPNPPTVRLSDYWPSIGALPQNELWTAPGVTVNGSELVLLARQMTGENFSARISGRPGAGKTQLATALLLSIAYTNSPKHLAMVIIDPKVIDMMPLANLPHLAAPVATRDDECVEALKALVAEMESREERLRQGDRSFLDQHIFVYIDEMADLQSAVGKDKETVVTAVQRLTQRGRAYGFIVVGATQRMYEVDAKMYTKMNLKFALAADGPSDGFAATGVAGVQVHKLPGKGACELYPDNIRLQGFFVADAGAKDYDKQIGSFVADIRARWLGQGPHWRIAGGPAPMPPADFPPELQDETFASALADAYDESPDKFSGQTVRRIHQQVFGKQVNSRKAAQLRQAFVVDYAGN